MAKKVTDHEKLKELRGAAGLTQMELAEKVGVPLGTIKSVETGRIQLNQDYAVALGKYFDVEPDAFYREPVRETVVIAFMYQKGGAGKTTVSINLAYSLAEKGMTTLFIDTDAQMNASSTLGFRNNSFPEKNFYDAYVKDDNLMNYARPTGYKNLDIVPSSLKMSVVEASTPGMRYREQHMGRFLDKVRETGAYDFVIIDTNPVFSAFNAAIIAGVDEIIIPADPEQYSLDMLPIFLEEYEKVRTFGGRSSIAGLIFNRHEKNVNVSKGILKQFRKHYPGLVFNSIIHRGVAGREAATRDLPVGVYQPRSRMADEYRAFAKEVIERVGKKKTKQT